MIEALILLLLLVNSIFAKKDRLYCGLFGWSGSSPKSLDYGKIKILGIQNDDRGGDGFGIFTEDFHIKSPNPGKFKEGLKKDALLMNLSMKTSKIFMGHTRKKSTGLIDLEHTQPIVIQDIENNLTTCLMHNGTVDRLWGLLDTLGLRSFVGNLTDKSDTQVLAHILHGLKLQNRDFTELLNIYDGTAALMFYFSTDPGGFYIFKGASKVYSTALKPNEERPLYYMKSSSKGLYTSSIEDSLYYIRDSSKFKDPEDVPENTLFRVADGELTEIAVSTRGEFIRNNTKYGSSTEYPKRSFNTYEGDEHSMGFYGSAHNMAKQVSNAVFATKTFETEKTASGNFIRKSPTLEYLSSVFNDIQELSRTSFDGDLISAFDYTAKAFSFSCMINSLCEDIVVPAANPKVVFYRGRYFVQYRGQTRTGVLLANGVFKCNYEGTISYAAEPLVGFHDFHFKSGILINKNIEMHPKLPFNETYAAFKILTSFKSNFSFDAKLRAILEYTTDPLYVMYKTDSKLIKLEGTEIVPATGTYIPLFSGYSYSIQKGVVISSRRLVKADKLAAFEAAKSGNKAPAQLQLPIASTPNKAENKETALNIVSTKGTYPETLTICIKCMGDASECELCNGDGYVTFDTHTDYLNKVSKSTASSKDARKCDEVDDCTYDETADLEAIDILKSLGNSILESKNKLRIIGDSSEFVQKAEDILDDLEERIIEYLYEYKK